MRKQQHAFVSTAEAFSSMWLDYFSFRTDAVLWKLLRKQNTIHLKVQAMSALVLYITSISQTSASWKTAGSVAPSWIIQLARQLHWTLVNKCQKSIRTNSESEYYKLFLEVSWQFSFPVVFFLKYGNGDSSSAWVSGGWSTTMLSLCEPPWCLHSVRDERNRRRAESGLIVICRSDRCNSLK